MAARARSRFDRDDDTGPRSDVYTGLLALSLIAMIVSSLLLFLDYSQYGASKAPAVTVPTPKVREGVQAGQLPPLPPPAPVTGRSFTSDTESAAAQPVKPAGGSEEAQAPVAPAPPPVVDAPSPMPAPDLPPAPVAQQPNASPPPAPEPVAAPPAPAPAAPVAPPPPPLPKSIRNLPN
jgi:hypothetical protein